MLDELPLSVDVDYDEPPEVEAEPDGWRATCTQRSLLPAALIGVALMLAWRWLGVKLFKDGAPGGEWLPIVVGGLLPIVFTLAFPIWAIRRAGGRVFGGRLTWPATLMEGAIALGVLAGVFGVNMVVAVVYVLVSGDQPGFPAQMEELAASGNPWALVLLGVMACIWAPIAEELFFRRFVLRALAERMHVAAAVGLQAVLFAVMHDYVGIHLAAIAVLGAALGSVYAWRKTILTPMVLHMLQNIGATIILGILMWLGQQAPVLGVGGEDGPEGCKVMEVLPGSAAEQGGIRPGDIITKADEMPVQSFSGLKMVLLLKQAGQSLKVEVLRDGETMTMDVVLQDRASLPSDSAEVQGSGVGMGDRAQTAEPAD